MLLHSLETNKSPINNEREEEVSKTSSKNSSHETEREDNSSEDTHITKNKSSIGRKRKQLDHLDDEFKKIKPSTFDGESNTGE
jgi:RNA polymerase-binding transcription factor DksA